MVDNQLTITLGGSVCFQKLQLISLAHKMLITSTSAMGYNKGALFITSTFMCVIFLPLARGAANDVRQDVKSGSQSILGVLALQIWAEQRNTKDVREELCTFLPCDGNGIE